MIALLGFVKAVSNPKTRHLAMQQTDFNRSLRHLNERTRQRLLSYFGR